MFIASITALIIEINLSLPLLFEDLLMLWAQEMKKCNEIMNSMAECQTIYEEKARAAEQKLEDWKKGNRKSQKDSEFDSYSYKLGKPFCKNCSKIC